MSINVSKYAESPEYGTVYAYDITMGDFSAKILSFGATWQAMTVPGKDGTKRDVLLGFDTLEGLLGGDYEGMIVGRYANRLSGSVTVNGKKYDLEKNENGVTCLHSAKEFSFVNWASRTVGEDTVELIHYSPDGAAGFPGRVDATVRYTLTADGAMKIEYRAVSDQDTVLNFTNHAYFNLSGKGDILNHTMKINASAYVPVDKLDIPWGEIRPVEGTAFDFRTAKPLGQDMHAADEQIQNAKGYDHNFCVDGEAGTLREAAVLRSDADGITMTVLTDNPGIQMYTGNFLDMPGKGGVHMGAYSGVALETQYYPDTPNRPEFPQCTFKAGEEYRSTTVYQFSVDK